jgi:hypothetical protein
MDADELEDLASDLPVSDRVSHTTFTHPSEQAAARILDFYRIEWQYEPTTFPLEWDDEGRVIASFTPTSTCPTRTSTSNSQR